MEPAMGKNNVPESLCESSIRELGLMPTKRGWPDFMAFDKDGRLAFVVEVKPTERTPLKGSQFRIMCELQRLGVKVKRFDPGSGFSDFNPSSEKTVRARAMNRVRQRRQDWNGAKRTRAVARKSTTIIEDLPQVSAPLEECGEDHMRSIMGR